MQYEYDSTTETDTPSLGSDNVKNSQVINQQKLKQFNNENTFSHNNQ